MIDPLERFTQLKQQLEKRQREAERQRGVLDALLSRLKEEHGCSSVEEAEKLLARLQREAGELEAKLARELTRFKEKWKGELDA